MYRVIVVSIFKYKLVKTGSAFACFALCNLFFFSACLPNQQGEYGSGGIGGSGSITSPNSNSKHKLEPPGNSGAGGSGGTSTGSTTGSTGNLATNYGKVKNLSFSELITHPRFTSLASDETLVKIEASVPKQLVNQSDYLKVRVWGPFEKANFVTQHSNQQKFNCALSREQASVENTIPDDFIDNVKISGDVLQIPSNQRFHIVDKNNFYVFLFCYGYRNPRNIIQYTKSHTEVLLASNEDSDEAPQDPQEEPRIKAESVQLADSGCQKTNHHKRTIQTTIELKNTYPYAASGFDINDDIDVLKAIQIRFFTDNTNSPTEFKKDLEGGYLSNAKTAAHSRAVNTYTDITAEEAREIIYTLRGENSLDSENPLEIKFNFKTEGGNPAGTIANGTAIANSAYHNYAKDLISNDEIRVGLEFVVFSRVPINSVQQENPLTSQESTEILQFIDLFKLINDKAPTNGTIEQRIDFIRAVGEFGTTVCQ